MSNSEKKSPLTTNGVCSDPMQRLASFKTPRDLSLGGVKPNKKVFVPNLKIARSKTKGPARVTSNDDNAKYNGHKDRNRNRNGPHIIKSGGVFAEGMGTRALHATRESHGRDSDATTLHRPTIRVKDVTKIDKELDELRIRTMIGDNVFSNEDASEEFKKAVDLSTPIKLPMGIRGRSISKSIAAVTIKEEPVVKQEPDDDDGFDFTHKRLKAKVEVKKEVFDETDLLKLLRTDQQTLMLVQVPDMLPGRGGSPEEEPRRSRDGATDADPRNTEPADDLCRLEHLEEGRVGKLLLHRSGRVRLVLGQNTLDVRSTLRPPHVHCWAEASPQPEEVFLGTPPACYQEIVSMASDDASRSANVVSLGLVRHKLVIEPSWEALFGAALS